MRSVLADTSAAASPTVTSRWGLFEQPEAAALNGNGEGALTGRRRGAAGDLPTRKADRVVTGPGDAGLGVFSAASWSPWSGCLRVAGGRVSSRTYPRLLPWIPWPSEVFGFVYC